MRFLKGFGLFLSVMVFGPLLILIVASIGFQRTIANQAYTQNIIEKSGLYTAAGQGLISAAIGSGDASPVIESSLKEAASPATMERVFSPSIQSTYDWMEGKRQQPSYTFNLTEFR